MILYGHKDEYTGKDRNLVVTTQLGKSTNPRDTGGTDGKRKQKFSITVISPGWDY